MESKKTQDEARVTSTRIPSASKIELTSDPTASIFGSSDSAKPTQESTEKWNPREGQTFRTSLALLGRLLAFSRPEWKQIAMACVSAVLAGAIQRVFGFSMRWMISVYFLPIRS
ncbi:uncharacterized protein J3R85_019403 [Psidium guajava]|nr:uncharacterized protein J3R85_019403 [Psidium guajava]